MKERLFWERRSGCGVIVCCLGPKQSGTCQESSLDGNMDSKGRWVAGGTLLDRLGLDMDYLGSFPKRLC